MTTEKENEIARLTEIKTVFLAQYKALEEPLQYAQNDFESDLIKEQRRSLVASIKEAADKIESLQS